MEFIKVAYMVSLPVFILLIWMRIPRFQLIAVNLMAVSNFLLIGNALFLMWQLYSAYQLSVLLGIDIKQSMAVIDGFMIRVGLLIVLPFLSLFPMVRRSLLFTVIMLILLYWTFPLSTWNSFGLLFKIPGYLCLVCFVYALGWLLNKLPYQSGLA